MTLVPLPHVKVEEEVQQLPKRRMKKQEPKASKEFAAGLRKLTSSLSITLTWLLFGNSS